MKITGAIFDMDGTLLDSMFIWETIGKKYLESIGFSGVEKYNKVFRTTSLHNAVIQCKTELNIQKSIKELEDGVSSFAMKMYLEDVKPKNDVVPFLEKLKKMDVKMCVATATDREPVSAVLKKLNILDYFSEIFTEKTVGSGKLEPYMFRTALSHLGTEKDTTWIFEDALYAINTAKNDGFNVVGIYDASERYPDKISELSDIYIHSYKELDGIF